MFMRITCLTYISPAQMPLLFYTYIPAVQCKVGGHLRGTKIPRSYCIVDTLYYCHHGRQLLIGLTKGVSKHSHQSGGTRQRNGFTRRKNPFRRYWSKTIMHIYIGQLYNIIYELYYIMAGRSDGIMIKINRCLHDAIRMYCTKRERIARTINFKIQNKITMLLERVNLGSGTLRIIYYCHCVYLVVHARARVYTRI